MAIISEVIIYSEGRCDGLCIIRIRTSPKNPKNKNMIPPELGHTCLSRYFSVNLTRKDMSVVQCRRCPSSAFHSIPFPYHLTETTIEPNSVLLHGLSLK